MNTTALDRFFDLIADDQLETAFIELETIIRAEAPLLLVDLTILRRRFNSANDDLRLNQISQADHQVEMSKIAKDFLYLVQQLPTDDELSPATSPANSRITGKLLHDIPSRFPLNRLTKCVIRIADSEQALLRDYQVTENTVIEDEVPIEKVMAVELIDLEEGKNFEIKALNSSVQQLIAALPTQWVYYVKALTPGEHLLVLRVSTVEMIDGMERPKEVLFERFVSVEAEVLEQPRPSEREWQPTHLTIGTAASPNPTLTGSADSMPSFDELKKMAPRSQPSAAPPMSAPTRQKKKQSTPWGKIAASLLILITAGWWVATQEMGQNPGDAVTEPQGPNTENNGQTNPYQPKVGQEPYDDDDPKSNEEYISPEKLVGTYQYGGQRVKINYDPDLQQFYLSGPAEAPEHFSPMLFDGLYFTLADGGLSFSVIFDARADTFTGFVSTIDPAEIWIKE